MISIDSTLNNQLSTINCFNERRHMSERVFYPDTDDVSSTSKVVVLSIARDRTRETILPIHTFLSRHSFSTRCSLVRRLVSFGGSLIRKVDQARGKVGGLKWASP